MKNSQKGSVTTWLVVVVVVALAVGFYLYQSGNKQPLGYVQQAQNPTTDSATTIVMQGVSMQPTYKQGVVLKISQDVSEIMRGQVIVFKIYSYADKQPGSIIEYGIKRVVGLPGETVSISGGILYVNGKPANITPVPTFQVGETISSVKLAADQYYVLGDNTIQSADSRALGPIKRADVTAVVTGVL